MKYALKLAAASLALLAAVESVNALKPASVEYFGNAKFARLARG